MSALPRFLKKYFWDADFDRMNVTEHSRDIIGRILEYGDREALRWLRKEYSEEKITDVLFHFRFVSPKSANFWVVILNLQREKVLCLQKPYLATQRKHWPY